MGAKILKYLAVGSGAFLTLALFFAFNLVGSTHATGGLVRLAVMGHFHTQALTCPPPDDTAQCVIDALTTVPGKAGLTGTNKLVTADYTEDATSIYYHDYTTITSQYGQFQGNEHGTINKLTGEFHSNATLMSTDGCRSSLQLHNDGTIDLDTLEDDGTYSGILVKKDC